LAYGLWYALSNCKWAENRCNNNSKAIAAVGHDTGEFKAKEVYDGLHSCQYDRK
jgi:hypothetical protein